jgi:hypothetical protein
VEWEKPSEQRFARRFAIASLPGFIVFRDGIHQQSFSGYDGNWQAFLGRLNLDADGAGRDLGGRIEPPTRPVTPAERALPDITDLRLEIDRLREQLRKQASGSSLLPETPAADENRQQAGTLPPLPPVLSIPPVDASGGSGAGIAADWAKVGAAALALFAPQVAIPAGAIGVAGTVFQLLRKRRLAMQQQPQRQTIVERPVVVATDTPPPPARVEQTTHYVPIERETHREAWQWAADQYARKYPGSEGLIQALNHLIGQYESSKREAA